MLSDGCVVVDLEENDLVDVVVLYVFCVEGFVEGIVIEFFEEDVGVELLFDYFVLE